MGDQTSPFIIWGSMVIVVIVVGIIASFFHNAAGEEAETAYKASVSRLARDPANPNLRKKTIELGRAYSNLTRNSKGIAYFDETALMNDISEACGGTSVVVQAGSVPTPTADATLSVEERLARLTQLKEREVISEDEYQAKRQRLIDEL